MALDSFREDFKLIGVPDAVRDTIEGNIVSTFQAGCFVRIPHEAHRTVTPS